MASEKLMNFKNATLKSVILGDLDKLTWVETPKLASSNKSVQVRIFFLNKLWIQKKMAIHRMVPIRVFYLKENSTTILLYVIIFVDQLLRPFLIPE